MLRAYFFQALLIQLISAASTELNSCSFKDDETNFTISWSAGTGFVEFSLNFNEFPTNAPHWIGVGFGDENEDMKLALIETNHRRVAVSSAKIRKNMPPIKLPTENMVTKGYGSLDQDRLRIFFSIPVYYFRECKTWTFFTNPTQAGMPYLDTPQTRKICNVLSACTDKKSPHAYKAYPNNQPSLNIQLPDQVSQLLDQPIDANIDITGGVHVMNDRNGANIRFTSPYGQQNSNGYNNPAPYGQQPYNNQNPSQQPYNNQGFNDPRFSGSQNMNGFTIDNPNYKFLPDGLGYQYEANSGRQRFYDNNGNPIGANQFGSSTEEPIRSNADQNKLNYQEISSQGYNSNPNNNQQFTNNIYGYDYRSNPGSKYTINGSFDVNVRDSTKTSGNEKQYQPPQNQRYPSGKRKKRQSRFRGTAYQNQDSKFPRVENTVRMSTNNFDDTTDFNTNTQFINPEKAYYDSQNAQSQGQLYYPYRTNTASELNVGPLAPYYINSNNQLSNNNENRQFDSNPYSTNNYNPVSPFYRQNRDPMQNNQNQNGKFNPMTHQDIHQYDDINCQGTDPSFCKDYVKNFQTWFRSYGGASQGENMCASLKKSLYHTDHHCCQTIKSVNC